MWCSDSDEFDDEEWEDAEFSDSGFADLGDGKDAGEEWTREDEAPTRGSRSEPDDDIPY
jgi:hypothetical protein